MRPVDHVPYVLETLDPLKYCEVTDTYYIWDPNTGIWTDYSKISLEEHLSTTYRDTVNTAWLWLWLWLWSSVLRRQRQLVFNLTQHVM